MNERTICIPISEYAELVKARVERDCILESYVKESYSSFTYKLIELIKQRNDPDVSGYEEDKDA